MEDFFQHGFLQEIELRAIAKETRFVDGEIFEQQSQFGSAFTAGEQTVVAVERIQLTGFQAALQAVLQKMRAALVEKHAAFLIDERLQKLEFGFGELNLCGYRSHSVGAAAVRLIPVRRKLLRGKDRFRGLLESP